MGEKINVLIICDQPIYGEGLKHCLAEEEKDVPIDRVFTIQDISEIKRFPYWGCVDVIIMEELVDNKNLLSKVLPNMHADQRIILVGHETSDDKIKSKIGRQIKGFLHYKADRILFSNCLRKILHGEVSIALPPNVKDNNEHVDNDCEDKTKEANYLLTNRETEVLRKIYQAKSNKEIAEDLYISHQTVNVHRKNLMKKLGVNNSVALILKAQELHIIDR